MKNLIRKYLKLAAKIPERHYWPLFIFLSLYFVVPYSEFVVTILALGYFKFEQSYRNLFFKVISPLPDVIKYGGSIIFFLVLLDDTLFYAIIILAALWTSKGIEKQKKELEES
jgi:hypothetical protein